MTELATLDTYGELIEPTTLQIQRLLPGSIERVWDYLTKSELRRKWFAAGDMQQKAGTSFKLTWRNDELTNPPGKRPEGFGAEHTMEMRITEIDPPHKLAFTFGAHGHVTFALQPAGQRVLLTMTHRNIPDRATTMKVGPGWHMHLDILAARISGEEPEPFWDGIVRLRDEYERRIPG